MWKMDSDQKSIPVVGFLTRNDCDILRAKTGVYRRVIHRTIILPTSVCCGLRAGFWPFANMEKPDNLPQGSVTCPQGLLALDNEAIVFLKSQCNTEMALDQYSPRSEEHTSELQSPDHLVFRLLL